MQTLTQLFDMTKLMPHGYCVVWNPALLYLHVFSDALIVMSYYAIPLITFYFIGKNKGLPLNKLRIMFAAFIFACGTTHLLSIISIWLPLYWLEGWLKLLTALLSVMTAIATVIMAPKVIAELGNSERLKEEIVLQAIKTREFLNHEVNLRTHGLQLLTEQAQSDLQVKRSFLSNMSHEIRTPINAIMSINYLAMKTELTEQQQN